jgi:hypothetical protein
VSWEKVFRGLRLLLVKAGSSPLNLKDLRLLTLLSCARASPMAE